jgi:hypothetical protein
MSSSRSIAIIAKKYKAAAAAERIYWWVQ